MSLGISKETVEKYGRQYFHEGYLENCKWYYNQELETWKAEKQPKTILQKIKNFFKEDERDEYELFFNSKFDNFNTLSETKLEEEINLAKKILISSKKDEEKIAETLKSVKEKL